MKFFFHFIYIFLAFIKKFISFFIKILLYHPHAFIKNFIYKRQYLFFTI